MRYLIWIPDGRLGNLIFQHQAITNIYGDDIKIITPDVGLKKLFTMDNNFYFIKFPALGKSFYIRFFNSFFLLLGKLRIFSISTPKTSLIKEKYITEEMDVVFLNGIFNDVIVFKGFFQYEIPNHQLPNLRPELILEAENLLSHIEPSTRIAIHLRFGDYLEWDVLGIRGASLPEEYYYEAIKRINSIIKSPTYIVFSDDLNRAKKLLSKIEIDCRYYDQNLFIDFALIAQCSHAIISASSFSWWASYFIKNRGAKIFAPKFWLGFKSKIWFPKHLYSNKFEYLDVDTIK